MTTDAAHQLRVLTICEGIDSVLRMAAWLPELPADVIRLDLSLGDALALLQSPGCEPFDILVFAPDPTSDSKRLMAGKLLNIARTNSTRSVVLLPPGQNIALDIPPDVEVLQGPPFAKSPHGKSGARTQTSWLQTAFNRIKRASAPAKPLPDERPNYQVIGFQGLAGGVGTTSLAITFAHSVAQNRPDLRVLLLDMNLQFSAMASYLNRQDDPRVTDLYAQLDRLDGDSVASCLQPLQSNLWLLSSPSEILPIDAIRPANFSKFISLLKNRADLIVIDMPNSFAEWTEALWQELDFAIAVGTFDIRCQHNYARLRKLSKNKILTPQASEVWINRTPAKMSPELREGFGAFKMGFGDLHTVSLPEVPHDLAKEHALGEIFPKGSPTRPLLDATQAEALRICGHLKPIAA